LTAAVVGGVAIAQTSSAVITACVADNSGNVRIVGSANDCKPNETLMSWNQQGPQGEPGSDGADGRDGVSGWIRVEAPISYVSPRTFLPVVAQCPEETKVLGGGYVISPDTDMLVYADYPDSSGAGWRVEVFNTNADSSGYVIPFAICATAL